MPRQISNPIPLLPGEAPPHGCILHVGSLTADCPRESCTGCTDRPIACRLYPFFPTLLSDGTLTADLIHKDATTVASDPGPVLAAATQHYPALESWLLSAPVPEGYRLSIPPAMGDYDPTRRTLKAKHSETHERLQWVWQHARYLISYGAIQQRIEQAAERLEAWLPGRKVLMLWSGGKDSLALQIVQRAWRKDIPALLCTGGRQLLFDEIWRWFHLNLPPDCAWIHYAPKYDLAYAFDNGYLYASSGAPSSGWLTMRWKRQYDFILEHGYTGILTGRRTNDNNFCGKDGTSLGHGVLTANPLYDWSHEETLAAIAWAYDDLPPTYAWPWGFHQGTDAWIFYDPFSGDEKQTYDLLMSLAPDAVYKAALFSRVARDTLQYHRGETRVWIPDDDDHGHLEDYATEYDD